MCHAKSCKGAQGKLHDICTLNIIAICVFTFHLWASRFRVWSRLMIVLPSSWPYWTSHTTKYIHCRKLSTAWEYSPISQLSVDMFACLFWSLLVFMGMRFRNHVMQSRFWSQRGTKRDTATIAFIFQSWNKVVHFLRVRVIKWHLICLILCT